MVHRGMDPAAERLAKGLGIRLLDPKNIRLTCAAKFCDAHSWRVRSIAVAPDGTRLASASADKTVRTWSVPAGTLQFEYDGHSESVASVAILPCGTWLASGGADRALHLWPAPHVDGKRRAFVQAGVHKREVTALATAANGSWIVSGSEDKSVKLWRVCHREGAVVSEPIQTLHGHTDSISSVAVSADSTWLASASWDRTVRLWTASGDALRTFGGHSSAVTAVAINPDGHSVASGDRDGTMLVWAAQSEGVSPLEVRAHTDKLASIVFVAAHNGHVVASGGRDDHVRVHSARTGEMLGEDKAHTDNVASVQSSPDGKWLVSGSHDHTLRLWSLSGESVLAASASG